MSKSFVYIIVLASILIGLSTYGFTSGTGEILKALSYDNPSGFKFGTFFLTLFDTTTGLFTLAGAAAGLIVGYFSSKASDSAFLTPIVMTIGGWIAGDLVGIMIFTESILQAANGNELSWLVQIVRIFAFLMLSGLMIAMVQFWRGND